MKFALSCMYCIKKYGSLQAYVLKQILDKW